MKKKKKALNWTLIVLFIFLIFALIFLFFTSLKLIGYIVKEQKKQVVFYFYDESSNCSLNGYVFSGKKLIGKTRNGYFNLTLANYEKNFNIQENISVFGKLGSCFRENAELLFDKYWEAFEIKEYYFSGESLFKFKTKIIAYNPTKRELLGFIQLNKVKPYLEEINLKKENTIEDLSKINQYLNDKINYSKDWNFYNETNYWQTPLETLQLEKGDCEDFSTALLSLFLAYNSSLNCYNIIFSSHVTTLCKIENYYIYFDREKTELKKQLSKNEETKLELKKLKENYFEHYGINITNETETKAYCAFNDNEFIEFENEKAFIDWQYNLDKKSTYNLFNKFDKELEEIKKIGETESEREIGEEELRTEKPVTEVKTLKGFFLKNAKIIFILGIVFIILVAILIKINVKK